MTYTESELIFSKEGIVVRSKTDLPLVGEDWTEKKIPYEQAFPNKKMELLVTSIEPIIENDILKGIKLKFRNTKEVPSNGTTLDKNDADVKVVDPIQRITNRSIKSLPDGTKIRFDWKGVTYETKIDSRNGKKPSLNSLAREVCRTYRGDRASINIYQHINARFYDERGWHPINELRT